MSNFNKAEYWFDGVEYDLQTARAMLETRRFLYVGFMCHQAVEKALKGCFVTRKPDEELPYIHKLVRLANLSELSSEMEGEQLDFLDELSPLNVGTRYPEEKERLLQSLTPSYCRELLSKTEELCRWIRKKC